MYVMKCNKIYDARISQLFVKYLKYIFSSFCIKYLLHFASKTLITMSEQGAKNSLPQLYCIFININQKACPKLAGKSSEKSADIVRNLSPRLQLFSIINFSPVSQSRPYLYTQRRNYDRHLYLEYLWKLAEWKVCYRKIIKFWPMFCKRTEPFQIDFYLVYLISAKAKLGEFHHCMQFVWQGLYRVNWK